MPEEPNPQVAEWLAQAATGSRDARDRLINHFSIRLRMQAKRMLRQFPRVRRWADTNDVYQNAMMRLVKALGQVEFQSEEHFLNMAALHIRQTLLDLARHYAKPMPLGGKHESGIRRPDDTSMPPAHDAPDRRFDPKALAAWSEFHERVAALPEEDRKLVEQIWYLGFGQAETAQRMGVSESTIRRNWRAVKAKLGDLDCIRDE